MTSVNRTRAYASHPRGCPCTRGIHYTELFALRIGSLISLAEMNQSSETRNMRGVWQRQHSGYRCLTSPVEYQRRALFQIANDGVTYFRRALPGQPAIVGVKTARLIDRREQGQVADFCRVRSPRPRTRVRCGQYQCLRPATRPATRWPGRRLQRLGQVRRMASGSASQPAQIPAKPR